MAIPASDLKRDPLGTLIKKLNQGGGGGGGGVGFVWTSAKTWDQVYAEVAAAGGVGVVYVPADGSPREVTPDPLGPTNLDGMLFVGIRDQDGNCPTVDIDSVGVGGFELGGGRSLHSKDVAWQTYYRIVNGPGVNCTWEFDGGGLTAQTVDDVYRSTTVTLSLRNGATLDGSNCANGLFVGLRNGATIYALGGSKLLDKVLYANVGVPPFPSITIYTDAGTTISPTAFVVMGVNVVVVPFDAASKVFYDDSLGLPAWGVSEMQTAMDVVKLIVGLPGHMRIDYWSGAEVWEDVYARMVQSGGGVLFVWHDGATPRVMTPNAPSNYDLSNIFFIGLRQADGSLPTIVLDPSNLGGFALQATGTLHSKNLHWTMPAYQIVDASIYGETEIELDGGSLTTVAASLGVWKSKTARLTLKNGALFDGSNCNAGAALIETVGVGADSSKVRVETLAVLGAKAFISAVVHPLTLSTDMGVVVDAAAFQGGTIVVTGVALDAVFGGIDQYGRPQIRDIRQGILPASNAVWRQGAWQVDGDSTNVEGDGIVVYGKDPVSGLQDGSNGAFARVKCDRFGIRLITGGVDVGYGYRTDLTETYYKDNAGNKTFGITRATGELWASLFRVGSASGCAIRPLAGQPDVLLINMATPFPASNAGIQYSSDYAGARAGARFNCFGNHNGLANITGFKSRGAMGAYGACADGDVLLRLTAIGVTGNGLDVPLAGMLSFVVPTGGTFAQSLSPNLEVRLATSVTNSIRAVWEVEGLSGDLTMKVAGERIKVKEGANAMQGVAVLDGTGNFTVNNTLVTANTRIAYWVQDGGPAPAGQVYPSARVVATSFTLTSTAGAGDAGLVVAWQLWEPAP